MAVNTFSILGLVILLHAFLFKQIWVLRLCISKTWFLHCLLVRYENLIIDNSLLWVSPVALDFALIGKLVAECLGISTSLIYFLICWRFSGQLLMRIIALLAGWNLTILLSTLVQMGLNCLINITGLLVWLVLHDLWTLLELNLLLVVRCWCFWTTVRLIHSSHWG